MIILGGRGEDIVVKIFAGDVASAKISLFYIGGGVGPDPTHPGQQVAPKSTTKAGDQQIFILSGSLLSTWLAVDGQLSFTTAMRGNTVDQSDCHFFFEARQSSGILCATDGGQAVNGDGPYSAIDLGAAGSGVPNSFDFAFSLS